MPGAAERILRMAEEQAKHRQFLEKAVIVGDSKRSMLGLGAGVIVALAALATSAYIAFIGYPAAGAVIGALDIVGLGSVDILRFSLKLYS